MPRHVWAKVYCDLLRHPLLLGRPDCDKVLVVGLILHAKEHAPDGVLLGVDAEEARRLCGIRAPLKDVSAGLLYLVERGWLLQEDGVLVIRDFIDRQRRLGDTPEAHAARQKSYVTRRKQVTSLPTRQVTSKVTSVSMSDDGHESDAEVEVDEEHVGSSKGGESEGREPTACESVDKSVLASLKPEDRKNVSFLLANGKASEATELLARLTGLTHLLAAPAKDHGGGSR